MATKQDKEEELLYDDEDKPTVWSSVAHAKIPGDAWEYQIRKFLNDAAYNGLDYVPYCPLMPIPKETDQARFMWKKKPAGGAH